MHSTFLFLCLSAWPLLAAPGIVFEPRTTHGEWLVRQGTATPMVVTADRAAISVNKSKPVILRLAGANANATATGEDKQDSYSNYFSRSGANTGVAHYARLRYKEVYAGIDIVYHSAHDSLEYDFELQPGADPNQIQLNFDHASAIRLNKEGDLEIESGGQRIRQHRPKVFQNGYEIQSRYILKSNGRVHFALAKYDHTQPLLIDPSIDFSTYLGGPGFDAGADLYVDDAGYIYVAGSSQSPATPGLDPFEQPSFGVTAPYLFKFSPDGQRLIFYVTFQVDAISYIQRMTVDAGGNLLLTGTTYSQNFPLKNAVQTQNRSRVATVFVTKIAPDGKNIIYSTYLGGTGDESLAAAASDADGNLYITGVTSSRDFPMVNAFQSTFNEVPGNLPYPSVYPVLAPLHCFVTKMSPQGAVLFSTYLESSKPDYCRTMALAPDGGLLIGGDTSGGDFPLVNALQTYPGANVPAPVPFATRPFLAKLQPDGQALQFSTYLAGPVFGLLQALTVDQSGNIYVGGAISTGVLPTLNAYQATAPADGRKGPGFIIKLDPAASTVLYATYLAGTDYGTVDNLAAAPDGSLYVAGATRAADFPLVSSLQTYQGPAGTDDWFLSKLSPDGSSLLFSTYLGGNDRDNPPSIRVKQGSVYFLASTYSSNVPVTNAYQSKFGGGMDIVLMKIRDDTLPVATPYTLSSSSVAFQFVQGGDPPRKQVVTVTGPSFTPQPNAPWISIDSCKDGRITIRAVPDGLDPGTYSSSITLQGDGGSSAIQVSLTVLGAAPALDSITPNTIAAGSDDTEFVVKGAGPFTSSSSLLLFGAPWTTTPITIDDANTLRFTMPKPLLLNPGAYSFSVQNPQSAVSNTVLLFIQAPSMGAKRIR